MSWSESSSNQAGFKIERSTDNQTFVQVGATGGSTESFTDAGLSPGTTYYYRVRAYNVDYGNTAYASVASVLTDPNVPTGLGATPISASLIELNWTAPSGTVSGYNVYRGTTPGGENYASPLNGSTPITSTTYTDATVSAGTMYYYVVEAVNASGSGPHRVKQASRVARRADRPGSDAGNGSASQSRLDRPRRRCRGLQHLSRRGAGRGELRLADQWLYAGSLARGYNDTSVSGGAAYYYVVEAVNASGGSVASAEANAATPPVVSIVSPAAEGFFDGPATVAIAADTYSSVASVAFYADGSLLGTDANGADGWSWTWENATPGQWPLTAVATDSQGRRDQFGRRADRGRQLVAGDDFAYGRRECCPHRARRLPRRGRRLHQQYDFNAKLRRQSEQLLAMERLGRHGRRPSDRRFFRRRSAPDRRLEFRRRRGRRRNAVDRGDLGQRQRRLNATSNLPRRRGDISYNNVAYFSFNLGGGQDSLAVNGALMQVDSACAISSPASP